MSNNLATKDIKNLFLKKIKDFEKIDVAGPGFLNIKLTKKAWQDVQLKQSFPSKLPIDLVSELKQTGQLTFNKFLDTLKSKLEI